jgi:low affinity Fe/Cu permease
MVLGVIVFIIFILYNMFKNDTRNISQIIEEIINQ